jgi:hypothetical protein
MNVAQMIRARGRRGLLIGDVSFPSSIARLPPDDNSWLLIYAADSPVTIYK